MAATLESTLALETHAPDLAIEEPQREASAHVPKAEVRYARQKHAGYRLLAGLALAIIAMLAGYRWWSSARTHVATDNALVAGSIHQISSRVAGTVVEVLVSDNQRVVPGTALLKLDPRDFDLRVQQAQYQLRQAAAQVEQTTAEHQQATAHLAQAKAKSTQASAELEKARLDYERARQLVEKGEYAAISKQEFDASKAAYTVAQAAVELAKAEWQSSSAAVDSARALRAMAEAQRRTSEVSLADAQLQQSYTTIVAPAAGTVGRKSVEAGQRVQPGQALLAIVADAKWLVANFKETQLAHMQVGQKARVKIDALPGRTFAARVESFAPASGAQFALLPPDNATGNFTKIVQRVPVKVVFEPGAIGGLESRIVPGLSAVVEVQVAP
jgi:membrane fusion protein (multidrug efflux system)